MKTTHRESSVVYMITTGNWKDGKLAAPTFVRSQAESLRAAGCNVFLTIIDDRTSLRGILRNIRRLRKERRKFQPTLVHAQYGSVTAAIGNLIKGPLPLIVSFCGDDLLGTPVSGVLWRARVWCSRRIGLWAARRSAKIIVKSQNLLQALPSQLQHNATILPNGVDVEAFQPTDRDRCRARLGWDCSSRVVLFDGCWNGQTEDQSRKNPALARATLKLLTETTPGVQLQMMSNIPQPQIALMMNAADCLLVTSLQEGSPNIVKEAMACNLPVVSVPCGDVSERLRDTRPGAIRPYDPVALAEAVLQVLESGRRSNGRDRLFAQGLTTAKVAEQLLQTYQKAESQNSTSPNTPQQQRCAV